MESILFNKYFMKIIREKFVLLIISGLIFLILFSGQTKLDTQVKAQTGNFYFISSSSGDNRNLGKNISEPWKNFENLKDLVLQPGDHVLLLRGDTWNERMTIHANGTEENPVYVGPYGDITKSAPRISLKNDRNDICIVVTDLISKMPFNVGISYIHIDNLQLTDSRLGIYFRSAVSLENRGIKVTDCYFENMNCDPVIEAMLVKENIPDELNMAKGDLPFYTGLYRKTGGGGAEYVWPAAIMIGGKRGHPEEKAGYYEIEIHNNIFEKCITGVLAYYYNLPSDTNFFKNMNMSNCQITGTVNGILAVQGMDAGNSELSLNSRWGVFENLSILAGNDGQGFALGTTGGIVEDFANALFTDCNFSNLRNNGNPDGCGFDFESRGRNVTIQNSVFANNQGQGLLIMDNGRGPHENLTIKDSLFYNNLQSVTGNSYRWDITIWNEGNTNIRLINNHHISKVNTAGTHINRINSNEKTIFEQPRSFGRRTDGILEENVTFRRNDNLPDFNESVAGKSLQNSLKTVSITQKTYKTVLIPTSEPTLKPTVSQAAGNTPVPATPTSEFGSETSREIPTSDSELTSDKISENLSDSSDESDIKNSDELSGENSIENGEIKPDEFPLVYIIIFIIIAGGTAFGLAYLISGAKYKVKM